MGELFNVQKAAISKYLKNIYESGELNKSATVSIMETVQNEGELDENAVCAKFAHTADYGKNYNL